MSISAKKIKIIYSFNDATIAPAYVYNNVEYESKLISWWSQAPFLLDLNNDKIKDVILPISKGYGTGIDGSTPFIALTTSNGSLVFDDNINSKMPITTGGRRSEEIQLVNTEFKSFIVVAHDTDVEARRSDPASDVPAAELNIIQPISSNIKREDILPNLPDSTSDQPYAVDAHSMAVGDINGDGLDDIYVGHYTYGKVPYILLQNSDGTFSINNQDVFSKWQIWGTNDAALVDVNNDNLPDMILSQAERSSSQIFINDNGKFTENNSIDLPNSEYGSNNQLHMKTLSNDFDHDGDADLAIHWTRKDPYYNGNYIQILTNDGQGNYTDTTNEIPSDFLKDAYKTGWVEYWHLYDFNNDNHMDIVGATSEDDRIGLANGGGIPVIYFNDGKGRFTIQNITLDEINGLPVIYSDFDQDNLIEFITFKNVWANAEGTENYVAIYLYELSSEIGTGPNYSTNSAEQGAPGFNEQYYLNENTSAKESVDAGTYETGLEHYLAEGKDTGLKSFAPFTKVHGYSGNDTIVLREGDEVAFGYAGKDTIEGGAGNDAIDGGAGVDTAIYKDSSSAYTLTSNDDGTLTVVHTSPSEGFTDEGSDTLTSIEKMQFSDKTLSKTSLKYELSETIDTSKNELSAHSDNAISGTLNFNAGNNIVILDGQGKNYRGLSGDDTYFVSQLIPTNTKLSITDTDGSNIIQLPVNTYVDKSLFTKNAARLTLKDGREITINSADKFSYNVGGNAVDGTKGTDLTFAEFAEVFGVYDILNSSGAQTGAISDMYII